MRPLAEAWADLRVDLLGDQLVRAVASGRRKGQDRPAWRRVEVRPVDLRSGAHLQVTAYDETQAHTANHRVGPEAEAAVDALLAEPFGHWRIDTTSRRTEVRVTKKGEASVHTVTAETPVDRAHDRTKQRLLPADDPVLVALGLSDKDGRPKPSRQAKWRQVEEFLRHLDRTIAEAIDKGHLRRPTADQPLRIVDLGCGNAYLTLAAHRFLTEQRGLDVHLVGVDVKEQSRRHNSEVAAGLGIDAAFVVGTIADVELPAMPGPPDVVMALHACDTATDDALAQAVGWQASVVLAAPCCHHDVSAQLRATPPPAPHAMLVRHGILRERLADTLTDVLRESLLRQHGYRVDVVEFVESAHTPRNTLLRAVRTGAAPDPARGEDYLALLSTWGVRPRLEELLSHEPA